MKRLIITGLIPGIILGLFIQGIGCSPTKSVYRVYKKVRPEKRGLRKRVLVLPILDQAGVGEEKGAELTARLVALLKEDRELLIYDRMRPSPAIQKLKSPQFGIVTDPFLTKSADELGMNVLVTGVLNPFEVTSRKVGWWPIRRVKRELEISLLINAVDVIGGTLFLTNMETRKIKISAQELESARSGRKIGRNRWEKPLSRILEDQASTLKERLRGQPWRGRVVLASGERITINAGRDIGLTKGKVFEVFGEGELIRSASGRSIHILGPKVGEIKTVEVMESHASAIPLTGGPFSAGEVIRIKN